MRCQLDGTVAIGGCDEPAVAADIHAPGNVGNRLSPKLAAIGAIGAQPIGRTKNEARGPGAAVPTRLFLEYKVWSIPGGRIKMGREPGSCWRRVSAAWVALSGGTSVSLPSITVAFFAYKRYFDSRYIKTPLSKAALPAAYPTP